jgi:hypothetical protein
MALAYHQTQLLPLYFLAVAICAYLPGRGPFTLALSPAPFQSIKKYIFNIIRHSYYHCISSLLLSVLISQAVVCSHLHFRLHHFKVLKKYIFNIIRHSYYYCISSLLLSVLISQAGVHSHLHFRLHHFKVFKNIYIQNGSSLSSDTATTIVFPPSCYLCLSPRQGSVHTCTFACTISKY